MLLGMWIGEENAIGHNAKLLSAYREDSFMGETMPRKKRQEIDYSDIILKSVYVILAGLLIFYFLKLTGLLEAIGIDPELDVLLWVAGAMLTVLTGSQALIYKTLSDSIKINTSDLKEIRNEISNIRERIARIEAKSS